MAERAGPDCPLTAEDLVAFGMMGLLEAFERFGPGHNADFETFASFRIAGQMRDALLMQGGTTRRERQICKELSRVTAQLTHELGRAPEHEEIAASLRISMAEYWRRRQVADPVSLVPLPEKPESLPVAPPEAPTRLLALDARQALRDALTRLPERERMVIHLYYGRDCSLAEIGAILEVSPSRVCQVLSDARARLRKYIGPVDLELFAIEGAA
jgi:RNA polymerase sigma factor for flagellar operon FliA